MNNDIESSEKLYETGYLSGKQLENVKEYYDRGVFSLHTELRTLLYAGILGVTTGLGILVYKNIETIGHAFIIAFIGLACVGCFAWCFKNAKGFTKQQITYDNPFFDYVLLAACLLAGIFIAYLQYEYVVFGNHYGLATIIPTALYFFCAYYFDHRGVLSLAITGLGAWLGISVSPTDVFHDSFRYAAAFDFTGMGLGVALILFTIYATREGIKPHFNFTCLNFALHLIFLGALTGMFTERYGFVFFLAIGAAAWYFTQQARNLRSFNFLLFTTIYSYIAVCYLAFQIVDLLHMEAILVLLIPAYFVLSCVFIIKWLVAFKKSIKA